MKNIKISLIAILIITVFASCEDLFKGAVLEVELPEHESQLAPYGFFRDTDTILTVMVGKSVGILDTINPYIVYGATVELYKNGALDYIFTFADSIGGYQVALNSPFNPVVGDEYELRVSAEGFESTSAIQVIPEKVEIIDATFNLRGGVNQFGETVDIIDVKFQDPTGVSNFYEIGGYADISYTDPFDTTYTFEYRNEFYFESNDPNFSNGTISDANFDGQEYTLRLESYNFFDPNDPNVDVTSVLNLSSATPEYATFINSLNDYWLAEDNPFAEPVLLYSNMSGGVGAFGIFKTSSFEF